MNSDADTEQWPPFKPKRRQTRFLKRHIVKSDHHMFVARVYKLGIVSLNFDTYEELAKYPDCKYAIDTGEWVKNLASRMESLNLAGDLIWPEPMPPSFKEMPVSRYQWLTVAKDVFLIRYVSVIDCALLLVNQVFELGLTNRSCTIEKVAKAALPSILVGQLRAMFDQQEIMRMERNARVHQGYERDFTDDDQTFKVASLWNDRGSGMIGNDMFGRKIDVDISFRAGLVGLQKEFNEHVLRLETQLDQLYDILWDEFEDRFGPLIAAAKHGLNANSKKPCDTRPIK
jgi:hypothetical protein